MRKKLIDELAEQAGEPEYLAPFERFKDLTRRLVAVPKADVDAVQAAEQSAKAKKREASP